jgi:hypothetical protein
MNDCITDLPIQEKEDVHATTSQKRGVAGLLESFMRRFRTIGFFIVLTPLIFLILFAIGLSLIPGVYLFSVVQAWSMHWSPFLHYFAVAMSLAIGFLLYGVTLIFVVPLINFLMPFRVKPWRGTWFTLQAIPWYVHNALTQLARYTFLDHITPTPINALFYRLMGMKIGKGVIINTSNISDPGLITIGDFVTIGGSATIFAHYGQKGYLIISNTVIGKGATIGLKASIMGDVEVGDGATITPHTVLMPKTRVAANEVV